jgi:hypothetical protein
VSTRLLYFVAYLAVVLVLGSLALSAQTLEPEHPSTAFYLIAAGSLAGFSLLGFLGLRLLQIFHLGRTIVAGLATLAMPFLVEFTLSVIDTPVNTEGLAMVAVVFYWGMSLLVTALLLAGAMAHPFIESRSSIASHPETR